MGRTAAGLLNEMRMAGFCKSGRSGSDRGKARVGREAPFNGVTRQRRLYYVSGLKAD